MKEIDPELFVTCRLCLEDRGAYLIKPDLQKQIKFCFDIDVDPYDDLSHVLCKKCKALVNSYYQIKETFLAKQESLKLRSSQIQEESPSTEDVQEKTRTLKRKRIISSSSESESATPSMQVVVKNELGPAPVLQHCDSRTTEEDSNAWKTAFTKLFICKLCNKSFRTRHAWASHFHSHAHLLGKYSPILTKTCSVMLNRIEGPDKPNMTGDLNKVVYSSEKIIKQSQANYYLVYTRKGKVRPARLQNVCSSSGSSDSEGNVTERRRSRLTSRSSRETMVLEDTRSNISDLSDKFKIKSDENESCNTMPNGVTDCINIDDSSDGGSFTNENIEQTMNTVDRNVPKEAADEKTIRNIIFQCHAKYLPNPSKLDKQNKSFKDQLKHKVLSVGKKILHKRCFNSTGILRYMELNDLKVEWIPKASSKMSSSIHAKIEANQSSNKEEWIKVPTNPAHKEFQEDYGAVIQQETNINPLQINPESGAISMPDLVIKNTFSFNEVTHSEDPCDDPAVLYLDQNVYDPKSKLLNENPVANPKQLPKKLITNKQNTQSSSADIPTAVNSSNHSIDNDSENMYMPIITSTKSLADSESNANVASPRDKRERENATSKEQTSIVASSAGSAPRIKVKPVSELMSESTLQNLKLQQTNMNKNQQSTELSVPETDQSRVPSKQAAIMNGGTSANKDYIILDTVEMPNMKTKSPFKYLRNLLTTHNIVLLDMKHPITRDFTCLIKFSVLYNQESKQQPIVVCLSLFNNMHQNNSFCIKIKDKQQQYINVDDISPNWQWELLKLYKGDVVNKVLQNAMKISQETFNYTQTFLCLLNSINLKTES